MPIAGTVFHDLYGDEDIPTIPIGAVVVIAVAAIMKAVSRQRSDDTVHGSTGRPVPKTLPELGQEFLQADGNRLIAAREIASRSRVCDCRCPPAEAPRHFLDICERAGADPLAVVSMLVAAGGGNSSDTARAVRALGMLDREVVRPLLLDALECGSPFVRLAAAGTLARIDDAVGLDWLVNAVDATKPEPWWAVTELSQLGQGALVADRAVELLVAEATRPLRVDRAEPPSARTKSWELAVARAGYHLYAIGDPASVALERKLTDPHMFSTLSHHDRAEAIVAVRDLLRRLREWRDEGKGWWALQPF